MYEKWWGIVCSQSELKDLGRNRKIQQLVGRSNTSCSTRDESVKFHPIEERLVPGRTISTYVILNYRRHFTKAASVVDLLSTSVSKARRGVARPTSIKARARARWFVYTYLPTASLHKPFGDDDDQCWNLQLLNVPPFHLCTSTTTTTKPNLLGYPYHLSSHSVGIENPGSLAESVASNGESSRRTGLYGVAILE